MSEIDQEVDLDEDRGPEEEKKSRLFSKFNLPDLNPHKPLIKKLSFLLAVIAIISIIFMSMRIRDIDIESIGCEESKLKLTANEDKTPYKLDSKDLKLGYVYSENINLSNSTFRIIVTSDRGKIAFRASRNSASGGGYEYYWGKNCRITKTNTPNAGGTCTGCCEDAATGGNCCSTGAAASECSCSSTNNKCACCELTKWIDYAINNQEPHDKIRPSTIFLPLIPTFLYMLAMYFMIRGATKIGGVGIPGGQGIFGGGGSLNKTVKSKVTFKDVAGIDEVKQELEEVVDYLKNPTKYHIMGARGPKGIVLYGPPGTGKTLLAKAVSGEADVPFIEASGSSFDDMFVGVGAKRIRDLFNKARKLSPCIIFIDEIDAVAGKRGNKFVSGGGGVADQTINQLLSEMDGFNTTSGVVVIAATNRLDSLDEAILRPGRFDRCIQVNLPNITGRIKILEVHARNKNISSSVDLEEIARKTPGFSGAQLENLLNEAVLMAVRENKKVIRNSHIDEAIDRVIAGVAKKDNVVSFNDKKQVAYHEAGHAIVGLYVKGGEIVEKVTIIPRGKALGYMLSTPEKLDPIINTKEELLAIVTTTLAGRAAEEIFFGEDQVGTGASNDLFRVTNLVRNMVTKYGMSRSLGLIQYEPSEGMENPYKSSYSEKSSEAIDGEIRKIVSDQYEVAKQIILDNREEFLLIAEALLLIETLDRRQINYIHENRELPKEAQEIKSRMKESDSREGDK